jgi:hypothetical protein
MAVDGSVKNQDKDKNVGTCWKEEEEEIIVYSVVVWNDFIG